MDGHDRSARSNRQRRHIPRPEALESRSLRSVFAPFSSSVFGSSSSSPYSAQVALVRHEYDTYVGAVRTLEFKSQATPQEFQALRNDAREISAAASATKLPLEAARTEAVAVSLQLDRSPLYGWAGDSAWSEYSTRLEASLDSLGVDQSLIDSTLADTKAISASAGVSFNEFQTFTNAFSTLHAGEKSLPYSPYYSFEDPELFYTQHLRGFFRGWGMQKVTAERQVKDLLFTIKTANQLAPTQSAVLHRDVQLLENLGATLPSTSLDGLYSSYVAAFQGGMPTPAIQSQLRENLLAALGSSASAQPIGWVNGLVADAPSFYRAVGSSTSTVQNITNAVTGLVDAGGGESLNPFKVTIRRPMKS
jgi:hypothetical protein